MFAKTERSNSYALWVAYVLCVPFLFGPVTRVAHAQARFELVAPQIGATSQAEVDANSLRIIDSQGAQTVYTRDGRYDSADGQWLGFFSNRAGQILRWPVSGSGGMQIGQLQPGDAVNYRLSQMTIRALGRPNDGLILPPAMNGGVLAGRPEIDFFSGLWQDRRSDPLMLQLSTIDDRGEHWILSRADASRLVMQTAAAARNADWFVVPATRGFVRLQSYDRGRLSVLAASPSRTLILEPISQDIRQLWQVTPSTQLPGRYLFENAAFRGFVLGGGIGNNFGLQPVGFLPHQMWLPIVPPAITPIEPFWRNVTSEVRLNPPLEPAQLELANSHRYALIVLIGDRRTGNAFTQVRVEPNSHSTVTLDRDAGATLIETIEIRSPSGVWDQQQLATPIPPTMLYDLSVYEEFLQSIAIDRTGTSPNPIEDVNYVPKSVGWLPIPPGDALPAVSRMDVYPLAQAAKNPGAVRRFDPKSFDRKPTTDPLETILNDLKPKERRKF